MSNNKQSSVDWLINQALEWSKEIGTGCHYMKFPSEALEQAKAMHKKQSFETFKAGQDSMEEGGKGFDQWYQETFGGNNED